MGKYTEVSQDLKKLPFEERYESPAHATRVLETKEQLGPMKTVDALNAWRDLRAAKDEIEEILSNINLLIDAHIAVIEEKYEGDGINSMKLEDGFSLSMNPDPIAVFETEGETKEEREESRKTSQEKFRQWCVKNGLTKSLRLWPATMQALIKEMLEGGQPLPPGVKAHFRNKFTPRGR